MNTDIVKTLLDANFPQGRMPRSPEYMQGVRELLNNRAHGADFSKTGIQPGTAQADAYFAGIEEGKEIWRKNFTTSQLEARVHKANWDALTGLRA